MAQVPEVVIDLYEGVPKDCFVSGVPFSLRTFDDNEVIPCFDTVLGPDGVASKWIRFCDYYPFIDALKAFWMGSLELESQGMVPPVYVYVMPYTTLMDAWCLHELIHDAYAIMDDLAMQPVDLDQGFGAAAVPLKQGTVEFSDGHNLSFHVVNYKLLYSKAYQFRVLSYVIDPLHEALHRFDIVGNLLNANTGGASADQLVLAANDAKRRLALVLMEKFLEGIPGVDPHDALLAMFPEAEKNIMTAEGTVKFNNIHGDARGNIRNAINPTIEFIRVATTSHSLMGGRSGFLRPNGEWVTCFCSWCWHGGSEVHFREDRAAEERAACPFYEQESR